MTLVVPDLIMIANLMCTFLTPPCTYRLPTVDSQL